jgi:transcriptional regulator with XRE-family HTH domain
LQNARQANNNSLVKQIVLGEYRIGKGCDAMSINFRGLQERLRERLLAHINAGELSGLQLARATGFQQAHISNFLNRKRGLSLEAMDAVLHATHISLHDLFTGTPKPSRHPRTPPIDSAAFVSIPIIDEENSAATQVPNSASRDTLELASSMVQRLQPAMHIPRPHWQRFVAIRVKSSDVAAMAPRLTRRTVAVIDRHHNLPATRKSGSPGMYLVRCPSGFHIRYLELSGDTVLARPHNPEFPCAILHPHDGPDPLASVIGRLCFLHVQL